MRTKLVAILLVGAVIIAGSLGFLGGYSYSSLRTATETTTETSTVMVNQQCSVPAAAHGVASGNFTVEVSYQGPWNATVKTYSAFSTNSTYLHSSNCYTGTGTGYVYIVPWNPNGEQTVVVTAHKLDASDGNLTAFVTWPSITLSNSTIAPYGSVTTFISIAP